MKSYKSKEIERIERLKQPTLAKFDSNTYNNKKRSISKSTGAVPPRRSIRTIVTTRAINMLLRYIESRGHLN